MINIIKVVLIYLSLRPYKTIEMDNGVIAKVYRNGKLVANRRNKDYDKHKNN